MTWSELAKTIIDDFTNEEQNQTAVIFNEEYDGYGEIKKFHIYKDGDVFDEGQRFLTLD